MRSYNAAAVPVFARPVLVAVELMQSGPVTSSSVRVVATRRGGGWVAVVEYGGVTVGVEPVADATARTLRAVAREHGGKGASFVSTRHYAGFSGRVAP